MISVTVELENKNRITFKARKQKECTTEAINQLYPSWAKIRKTEGRYLEKTTVTHKTGAQYTL